jgi:hypothetical protein
MRARKGRIIPNLVLEDVVGDGLRKREDLEGLLVLDDLGRLGARVGSVEVVEGLLGFLGLCGRECNMMCVSQASKSKNQTRRE